VHTPIVGFCLAERRGVECFFISMSRFLWTYTDVLYYKEDTSKHAEGTDLEGG